MHLEERALFGDAIKIKVPANFKDVSDFRQVPDHQEVFVSNDSDASLIVEILESPSEQFDFEQGINFHWNELCQETGSSESIIEKIGNVNIGEFKNVPFLIGNQKIPKFGKVHDTTSVKIRLLCVRIPSISTDILISLSSPVELEDFTDELFIEICSSFRIQNWSLFK